MAEKWCEIIEIDGNQVLFTNGWDDDDEEYRITIKIKSEDWVPGCIISEVMTHYSNDKPFSLETFEKVLNPENAEKVIKNDLLPILEAFGEG